MELIEVADAVQLGVERMGAGPPVLLIGGLGMPSQIWELSGLTVALVDAGFSVIAYNARGVAPSTATGPPYSVDGLASDAEHLLEACGITEALVVGYSLGCYTAQCLVRRRPDMVTGAVFLAGLQPSPIGALVGQMELDLIGRLGEIPAQVRVFEQLMTTLSPAMLQDPETVSIWRQLLADGDSLWSDRKGLHGQLAASFEWIMNEEPHPEHLAQISAPVLVLAFEHDVFFPPHTSHETAQQIPNSQFKQIDGAAHGGLFSNETNVVETIAQFCNDQRHRLDGGGSRSAAP